MGIDRKIKKKKNKYVYFSHLYLINNHEIFRICVMCIVPMNDIKFIKKIILFLGFFLNFIGFPRIFLDLS